MSSLNPVPPLLQVRNLRVVYPGKARLFQKPTEQIAISALDLEMQPGEILALVGESGCGKTTFGRVLVGLQPASSGEILLALPSGEPCNLLGLARSGWKPVRRRIAMAFQDHGSALDPRMGLGDAIAEPWAIHGLGSRKERRTWALDLLHQVGLDGSFLDRLPATLSGGQRQRVGIARAIALKPDLLICDEVVSALDAVVQRRILDLLAELRMQRQMAILFITHDLAVARGFADRVAVMCEGVIVEQGPAEQVLGSPEHSFTRSLIDALPVF